MEFANNPLPQPSSLINNLILENAQKQSTDKNEEQKENQDEDITLVTYKDNSTYKGSMQDGKKHGE